MEKNEGTKRKDDWLNSRWRPLMGYVYMFICLFDFVIGPFFYAWFAWYTKDFAKFGEWKPLTMEGGGLFHVAMGAVLGVTAWGRTQEKLNGVYGMPSSMPNNTPDRGYNRYQYDDMRQSDQRNIRGRSIPKSDEPLI